MVCLAIPAFNRIASITDWERGGVGAGYWRAGCRADVVPGVAPHFTVETGWSDQLRKFG